VSNYFEKISKDKGLQRKHESRCVKTSEESTMDWNWKGSGLKRRSHNPNKVAEDVVFGGCYKTVDPETPAL
jgi:hypothetical protein